MDELEKVRNFIAHNRVRLPSEFQPIYLYIADWNKALVKLFCRSSPHCRFRKNQKKGGGLQASITFRF